MCDQATGVARLEGGQLVLEVTCARCETAVEVDRLPYELVFEADPPEIRAQSALRARETP